MVVDSSNVCHARRIRNIDASVIARHIGGSRYEGSRQNVPTVPRRATRRKNERRLRARPRRLGDARYHRASVRQRARGVGRGHDHEQVHDVSLAREVVQQERHRVFGVRRVLHGR